MIGSFCLSEPQSGSDARHMQTKAVRDGDYYVLNGTKNWISNGGEAGLYLVFASLEGEEDRSAAFLVEYWRFGIRCGPKEKKLGIRASATTQVFLQDCRVPVGSMLGEEGDGFKIAMSSLDAGRIGIAAQALGIAQAAFEASVAYAKERQAFGQPISEFQGIQFMLADMQVRIEQSRLLTYQAAVLEARGLPFAKESSMAKLSASETAMWVTTKAIQIHGGYGYSREYPVQRYFRDAKITEIYEGTSEIQRMVIARSILRGERPAKAPAEVPEAVPEIVTPVLTLPPTPDELKQQMAPRKLHHVAVAVDSVDEALKFYRETLGLEEITVMNLDDRGLKVGLIKAGPSEIELLEPLDPEDAPSRGSWTGAGRASITSASRSKTSRSRCGTTRGRGRPSSTRCRDRARSGWSRSCRRRWLMACWWSWRRPAATRSPSPRRKRPRERPRRWRSRRRSCAGRPATPGTGWSARRRGGRLSRRRQRAEAEPEVPPSAWEPPAQAVQTPIVRGPGGYTRHGLVSGGPTQGLAATGHGVCTL